MLQTGLLFWGGLRGYWQIMAFLFARDWPLQSPYCHYQPIFIVLCSTRRLDFLGLSYFCFICVCVGRHGAHARARVFVCVLYVKHNMSVSVEAAKGRTAHNNGWNQANGMALDTWKPFIWYHSTDSAPAITTSPSTPIKVPPTSCGQCPSHFTS